jgi:hypothetical protein
MRGGILKRIGKQPWKYTLGKPWKYASGKTGKYASGKTMKYTSGTTLKIHIRNNHGNTHGRAYLRGAFQNDNIIQSGIMVSARRDARPCV